MFPRKICFFSSLEIEEKNKELKACYQKLDNYHKNLIKNPENMSLSLNFSEYPSSFFPEVDELLLLTKKIELLEKEIKRGYTYKSNIFGWIKSQR